MGVRWRIIHNLRVKPENSQFNAEIPKELHKRVVSMAKRKGLTVAEYTQRLFRAALDSEEIQSPGFLETWEKLLLKHGQKKT